MPLHSARPRESVPRLSRHKPPCFITLDTASCSGTLREPLTERREANERSYYNNKEQMDWTDWSPLSSNWITPQVMRPVTTRAYINIQLQPETIAVIWRHDIEQIQPERRGAELVGYTLIHRRSHRNQIYLDHWFWTWPQGVARWFLCSGKKETAWGESVKRSVFHLLVFKGFLEGNFGPFGAP